MVIIVIIMALSILAMLFGPLSPLVLLSSLALIIYERNNLFGVVSTKNRIISFLIAVVVGCICVILSYKLPYHDYYSGNNRRFFEAIGTINLYFTSNILLIKLKEHIK